MVFRGTYENGKVILDGDVSLPNGTRVDVQPSRPKKKLSSPKRSRPKANRDIASKISDPFMALIGLCKDRPDWKGKSGVEIQMELRDRTRRARSASRRH